MKNETKKMSSFGCGLAVALLLGSCSGGGGGGGPGPGGQLTVNATPLPGGGSILEFGFTGGRRPALMQFDFRLDPTRHAVLEKDWLQASIPGLRLDSEKLGDGTYRILFGNPGSRSALPDQQLLRVHLKPNGQGGPGDVVFQNLTAVDPEGDRIAMSGPAVLTLMTP